MAAIYTYATILQLVQDACVQLGLAKPNGVYDSQDEHAVFMGSIANETGPSLQNAYAWQQSRMEFEVIGDGVQDAFPLPADFLYFIDDTGWSFAKRRPAVIINAQQYAAVKPWLSQSFYVNPACRIVNDSLTFMTPPGLDEKITFEYVIRPWAADGDDPQKKKVRLDKNSDVPLHDSLLFTLALKIKWMEHKGMDTSALREAYTERFDQITKRNAMAQSLSLNGGTFIGFRYLDNYCNTPDTNIGV